MKKIILNFAEKRDDFKELVQEAFNKDILNFLAFIPPVLLIWWRRQKGEVESKSDGGEILPNPQI